MLSKARIKWIKSLEMHKYRLQEGAFVAEGPKLVGELLQHFTPLYVAATSEWLTLNHNLIKGVKDVDEVTSAELERASLLRTPQSVLTVMPIPDWKLDVSALHGKLVVALDGVQDPGNMGTILRTCDWFGIHEVLCSAGTTDVYGPKCVQACMGALARVRVHYCNLPNLLKEVGMPVYGTFLDGNNIYGEPLTASGVIVMGNEGNGISSEVGRLVSRRLYIPNFPLGSPTTESLNVAVATSIVCAEFRRQSTAVNS